MKNDKEIVGVLLGFDDYVSILLFLFAIMNALSQKSITDREFSVDHVFSFFTHTHT
jgi:small nuclear ribonucleoprotein (snRNP)-like protein